MGLIAHELNVDFNTPTFVPKPITDFLREISLIDNASERFSKLREYITSLEDEMRKIDAFRRELPLCMLLLRNAILYLKDESVLGTRVNTKQVLEEFIPLKKDYDQDDGGVNEDKDSKDKKSWMSSVQLWNSDNFSTTDLTYTCDHKPNSKVETKLSIQAKNGCTIEDPFETCKNNGGSKMFRPFRGRSSFPVPQLVRKEDKDELSIQGFSILGHGIKGGLMEDSGSSGSKTSCCRAASSSAQNIQSDSWLGLHPSQQQTNRKQRRCWSHELHRRFVNALQQLGGSQAATPKQIREFMQVDGLTNDEVKSHLQKYRLHTRRMPAPSATSVKQSAVDFVGQWVPQDQYGESSKHSSSQSGSPQGPLQLCRVTGEDEEDEKSENYS